MTPRPVGRPTAKPAVDGSIRGVEPVEHGDRRGQPASRRAWPAGTASGPGTSGGAGARCTGSARSSVPNVPTHPHPLVRPAVVTLLHDADLGRRHGAAHPQHLDAHLDRSRDRRGQEVRAPGERVGVTRCREPRPLPRRRPSAMSTPPLMACPISQPSPRWPRAVATAPDATARRGAVVPRRAPAPRRAQPPATPPTSSRSSASGRPYGDPMTGSIHWPTAVLVAGTMLLLWLAGVAAAPQPPPWLPVRGRPGHLRDAAHGIPRLAAPRRRPHARGRRARGAAPALHPRRARRLPRRPGQRAVVDRGRGPPPRPRARPRASRPARPGAPSSTAPTTSRAPTPTARSAPPSPRRSSWTTSSSAPSPPGPRTPRPGWPGRPRRSPRGCRASSPSPSSPAPAPASWRPSCARCGPRSAPTSSTTASPRSRRSCAPTPTAPASCSSTSPTSPATPCAPAGPFTTLAEELRNVERYLVLEQARFGDRLQISLLIAPEVLPVTVPYLAVQPLVENAVRHGLAGKEGVGHLTITASDRGSEAEISIEDDGVGTDPQRVRQHPRRCARQRLDRPGQRRRPAPAGLRRRVRARRRDGRGRGHEGDLPRAEVRSRHPRRAVAAGRRLRPCPPTAEDSPHSSSTTSCRPCPTSATSSGATTASTRSSRRRQRHRGPPGARRPRRRRRLQRHLDAGAGRHGPRPGHLPLLACAPRSSSSPPTTSTPSTRSPSPPPTTS